MWLWSSLLQGGAIFFFAAVLFSSGAGSLKWWRLPPALRKRYKLLPRGSLGWPLVGETLAFKRCLMSTAPHSFVTERRRRYGDLFLTHLFGSPLLASTDFETNKFILTREEPLFATSLAKSTKLIVGKSALLMLRGDKHKRMRRLLLSVCSPEALKHQIPHIQQLAISILKTWKGRKVIVIDDAREAMAKERNGFAQSFWSFEQGLVPHRWIFQEQRSGRRCRTAWQARKCLKAIVEEVISERRQNREMKHDDFLEKLLQAPEVDGGEPLENDDIVDLILSTMLAGFDTSANTLLFLVYYIGQHPQLLHELKIEHEAILRDKQLNGALAYGDYKKMKLTQSAINETLRLANPVLALFRTTLQDVETDGCVVPASCTVQVWLRSLHTDPKLFPQPYSFNVDRWKGNSKASNTNFIPFGLGPRLCAGMELARMELCFFIHCLLMMYKSWELAEKDTPRFFPEPGMREGLPIFVHCR